MVDYKLSGSVAVLEVNNPPVNALSWRVRRAISEAVVKANSDKIVSAIVVCGRGQFLAGADIKEFATGEFTSSPTIHDVCNELESSCKPVVAAIAGFALGGGLEVAISVHYRVAHEKAAFGFPEVDIGILPGASGTQRFPRLAGLKAALDLIPTGRRIGAKEALQLGVVDKVTNGDVVAEAIKFAGTVARKPLDGRITRNLPIKDAENASILREAAMKKAAAKSKGLLAPVNCIKSVMASVDFPFDKGLQVERELASQLFSSGQAQALQYAFFAQRMATKWQLPSGENHKTVKAKPIKTGGIIGAGTMGTGIAMAMLNVGISVVLVEQNKEFLDKGVLALRKLYQGSVALGRMSQDEAKACLAKLHPSVSYDDLKDVDMVIEAVYENMNLKKEIFAQLDAICSPKTFLCSNTSTLSIDEMASVTKHPERVIGTHFFVPAYYMRLLENIRGAQTSPETIAAAQKFGTQIGKVPVLVGNCDGFVGNRINGCRNTEAVFMVEEGCMPEDVDQVSEDYGFPLGSFKIMDLSGLDIGWRIQKGLAEKAGTELDPKARFINGKRYCALANLLCEEGHFGRKTGMGWYNYGKPGGKDPLPSEFTRQLIKKYRMECGVTPRRIPPQEVLERQVYSCINEAFKVLEEKIADKPEDIDTIMLLGFGWPRQTGGPMYYANTVGLSNILKRIQAYYTEYPNCPHWQPSRLLSELTANNVPMSKWASYRSSRL